MGVFVRHTSCPSTSCDSSDGFALYDDGSGHCFVCGHTELSEEYKEKSKDVKPKKQRKEKMKETEKLKPEVTPEQTAELKSRTTTKGNGYRGIHDDILQEFGVRTEYTEDDEVYCTYYPCTEKGQLVGWKPRVHPKQFGGSIGRTGATCDMFGQFRFEGKPAKFVLIVGGEHDQLAAYQMLRQYYKQKGWDFESPVVSPTIGESGCAKQLAANYEFFNSFDKIILGFDNDKAGQEAMDKAVMALPKGKVFIAKWSAKDPNEMLLEGMQREFISNFYEAAPHVPVGVVASNQISADMRKEISVPKVPLPPFMRKLQEMMAGGFPLGRIINLGSASGTGKSTIIDEILYFMLFNSPHKVGVVTLESTSGQYGIKLLSRHISQKIELLDQDSQFKLLDDPIVKQKEHELFNDESGNPRFYLVDDRDGDISDIRDAIENLIIACDCKVIVLDPVSDIIAALPLDEQDNFMSWQKGMIKSHMCTFLNVCHTRKTASGQKAGSAGADLHEEDLIGSSALYKSAACNLMFSRNKEAEDPIEKNTTTMKATKIRWTGKTGVAGKYYYDNESHTLHDLDDWLQQNGGSF